MSRNKIHPEGYLRTNQYHKDQLCKRGLISCPMWVSPEQHNVIALLAATEGVTMVQYVSKLFSSGLSKI